MIVQLIINFFRDALVAMIDLIPPLPAEWSTAIGWIGDAGNWVTSKIAVFNPLIPFDVLNGILTFWLGLVAFWLLVLGVRVVLWAVGR